MKKTLLSAASIISFLYIKLKIIQCIVFIFVCASQRASLLLEYYILSLESFERYRLQLTLLKNIQFI